MGMTIEKEKQRIEHFKPVPPEGMFAEAGSVADAIHRATSWKAALLDHIFGYFNFLLGGNDDNMLFDDLTVDWYDNSIELKGVQVGTKIPEDFGKAVYELGFIRFWVCFTDGTEQYCGNEISKSQD
jgi:hypothetical protein